MKKIIYSYPKSSFLSMEKDMELIVNMIMKNDNLKRMLYYTSSDCLNRPALTEDETLSLFETNIKITPRFPIDGSIKNYIVISFDQFAPNVNNPQFRDNIIEFDIFCHVDTWHLKDFQLRPYRIAAELDTMFNNKHLTGIGTLEFMDAAQVPFNDDYMGVCLRYRAVHGEEDRKQMPNPADEKRFVEDYNQLYNN